MAGENYRRVVPSFWTDPDVKRKLTLGQKALLLYFFTSPHSNMIGLYFLPLGYVAAETGLTVEDIRRDLAGVLAPFVSYDEETEEVLVRRAAFHQMGDLHGGDKRKEGVRRLLEGIHSPRLKRGFLEEYAGWDLGVKPPDTRKKPLRKPLAKPHSDAAEGATQAIAVAVAVPVASPLGGEVKPVSWSARACELWEQYRGEPNGGRIGGRLKRRVERHGPRQVLAVWEGYLEECRDKAFCNPEDFIANYEIYRQRHGVEMGEQGEMVLIPDEPTVGAAA